MIVRNNKIHSSRVRQLRQIIRAVVREEGEGSKIVQGDLEKSKLIINLRHYNRKAVVQDTTITVVLPHPMRQPLLILPSQIISVVLASKPTFIITTL